jgi:hypothetical protein
MDGNINAIDGVLSEVGNLKGFLEGNVGVGSDGLDIASNRELYLSLIQMIQLINKYKQKYIYIKYVLPESLNSPRRRFVPTEGPGTPSKVRYLCGSDSDSDSDSY